MAKFIVIKEIEAENEASAMEQLAEEVDHKLDLNSVFKIKPTTDQIVWMAWFKDTNDEYNWLHFIGSKDYSEATKTFFEVYKADFVLEEDDEMLPAENLIDLYPVEELGHYKIVLQRTN